ncbi:ABC transporter [Enterococcus xinjiangensis]|nr:ABC transporter [Enterococcus lactis]
MLNDITDFEIWEIERELQLMQTDPEILWREFSTLSGERRQKSYWHFYLWMTLISR